MRKLLQNAGADIPASVVVFLVALPLCLGVALGSNAPLFSGIIAGISGGIIVGILSNSPLSVTGPAAGLTAVVAMALSQLKGYDIFLVSVVIAGALQLIFGFLKGGIFGDYVPNAVIRGMLAAIGITLILKQVPHFVGYDKDFSGDEAFFQIDRHNSFSGNFIFGQLPVAGSHHDWHSIYVIPHNLGAPFFKSRKLFQWIPAPLVVVIFSILANQGFISSGSSFAIEKTHLVGLPVVDSWETFNGLFTFPKWKQLLTHRYGRQQLPLRL